MSFDGVWAWMVDSVVGCLGALMLRAVVCLPDVTLGRWHSGEYG